MSGQSTSLDRLAATPAKPRGARARRMLPVETPWSWPKLVAVQVLLLAGFVAAWEIAARTGGLDPFFWSQPSAIAAMLVIFFREGSAWTDIATTFRETILGFVLGTSAGAAFGLSLWWSRNWARALQPYIICFESIPKLALAPLVILVFGMGLASKVAIAAALTMVVSTITTYSGVRAVDPDGERLFYSLGASRGQVFRKFVVPSCLPWIISILRVNIGLALTWAVVGEFISAEHGLGRTIFYAGQTYEIALVWVAVIVLASLSVAMYVAVSAVEKVLVRGVTRG